MEKYIMDFFDDVVAGKYGKSGLTKAQIASFVEKANTDELEMIEDIYWDWTSVLCEPEDIDINQLSGLIIAVAKR